MEKLKEAYDYFCKIKNRKGMLYNNLTGEERFKGGKFLSYELFSELVRLHSFDEKPQILTVREFDKIQSLPYYHGFREYEHGVDLIDGKDYHYGLGYISGLYFTDDRREAYDYSKWDNNKILQIKINSDNYIDYDGLCGYKEALKRNRLSVIQDIGDRREIEKLLNFVKSQDNKKMALSFYKTIMDNLSCLGVIIGVDYITDGNYIIVLNRGKIITNDLDYARFKVQINQQQGQGGSQK